MISAFDVDSYNKPGFNFGTAWAQGCRAGYIKLGGDNLAPRYRGSGYQKQFDAFAAQPFEHRGSYWVTGGSDPAASARFYLANVDPRSTFDVLDNESLDDGRSWSDAEAAAFFDVLIAAGRRNLFQYGSRDALWNRHAWPLLEARGIKAIVAIYNDAPFKNHLPRTYPAGLVKGHQYTSSAQLGGLARVDANVFTDDAFGSTTTSKTRRRKMYLEWDTQGTGYLVTEDGVLGLSSPAVYNLFYRIINSNQLASPFDGVEKWVPGRQSGRPDTFLKAEMDIVNANLRLLAAQKSTGVAVDVDKLASALEDALGGKLNVDASLSDDDLTKLAAAYEAAVPRVVSALVKQAGEKLAS